jgi:hypothetical protein
MNELFRRRLNVGSLRGRRIIFWSKALPEDRRSPPRVDDIEIVSAGDESWMGSGVPGAPPDRRSDLPAPDGWLGFAHPDRPRRTPWLRDAHARHWGPCRIIAGGQDNLAHWTTTPRAQVRDVALTARAEFLGQESGWFRDSFDLVFRHNPRFYYAARIFRRGGAALVFHSTGRRGDVGEQRLAEAPDFAPPRGIWILRALAQGKHFELYCNGRLVLATDELDPDAGALGCRVESATVAIHDLKWRPLPSDPSYATLDGAR